MSRMTYTHECLEMKLLMRMESIYVPSSMYGWTIQGRLNPTTKTTSRFVYINRYTRKLVFVHVGLIFGNVSHFFTGFYVNLREVPAA